MLRLAGRLTDGEGTVMRRILIVDDDPHICLAIRAARKSKLKAARHCPLGAELVPPEL